MNHRTICVLLQGIFIFNNFETIYILFGIIRLIIIASFNANLHYVFFLLRTETLMENGNLLK